MSEQERVIKTAILFGEDKAAEIFNCQKEMILDLLEANIANLQWAEDTLMPI